MSIKERIKTISVGYNYVEVTRNEILNWGGYGDCDTCNAPMIDKGYLIFIKNRCICSKCFEKFKNTKKAYTEDLEIQEKEALTWYKLHLDEEFRKNYKDDNEEYISLIYEGDENK